nr:MAG TPA: hypothetical protein [Caudoviricetes sp.]
MIGKKYLEYTEKDGKIIGLLTDDDTVNNTSILFTEEHLGVGLDIVYLEIRFPLTRRKKSLVEQIGVKSTNPKYTTRVMSNSVEKVVSNIIGTLLLHEVNVCIRDLDRDKFIEEIKKFFNDERSE